MGRLDSRLRARHLGFVAGAAALGLSVMAIVAATSEGMLQVQFAAAAAGPDHAGSGQSVTSGMTGGPAVSGSESYWLGEAHHPGLTPVALQGQFAIGERISLDGAGGKRFLEIVAVAEVPASMAQAVGDDDGRALLMVTCRDVGMSGSALLRFIIEPGAPHGAAAAKGPRSL